jgi:hypothetical protein
VQRGDNSDAIAQQLFVSGLARSRDLVDGMRFALLGTAVHLPRLSRSLGAFTLALTSMITACSLPPVRPLVAPQMRSGAARPRTVAVLPPDLDVTVRDNKGRLYGDRVLNETLLRRIQDGLVKSLHRRGYQVVSVLRHDGVQAGAGAGALVVHPHDLGALRMEIEQVAANLPSGPGFVSAAVSADLTQEIRRSTNADASLYARGWVYIAPGDSKAAKAARVIGITLLVLVMIGLVVILTAGKGGDGIGKALGGAFKAAGHAAVKTAQVAGRVAIRVLPRVLEATANAPGNVRCSGPARPGPAPAPVLRCVRCYHVDEVPPLAVPSLARAPETKIPLPRRSTVGIGISLVENDTGSLLWHAGQRFEIEARGSGNVERLIEHYLRELPRAAPAVR